VDLSTYTEKKPTILHVSGDFVMLRCSWGDHELIEKNHQTASAHYEHYRLLFLKVYFSVKVWLEGMISKVYSCKEFKERMEASYIKKKAVKSW